MAIKPNSNATASLGLMPKGPSTGIKALPIQPENDWAEAGSTPKGKLLSSHTATTPKMMKRLDQNQKCRTSSQARLNIWRRVGKR